MDFARFAQDLGQHLAAGIIQPLGLLQQTMAQMAQQPQQPQQAIDPNVLAQAIAHGIRYRNTCGHHIEGVAGPRGGCQMVLVIIVKKM